MQTDETPAVEPEIVEHAVARYMTEEYLRVRDIRDEANDRLDHLQSALVELLGESGTCELAPGVGVRAVGPVRRFSADLARKELTVAQLDAISRTVPDASLARQRLSASDLARVQTVGRPGVRLLSPAGDAA